MSWFDKLKKPGAILMAGLLAAGLLLPAGGTGSIAYAEDNGCLAMVGTGNIPVTSIERNQMVTVNYTLDPSGTHTVTQSRDAIDVAFVTDVSGSMDYNMDKGNSRTPIRIDILKEASKTLTDKFKTVNMKDRLGLVKFSTEATMVRDLTTEYSKIQSDIDKLKAGGSTNIDDGLMRAKAMLTAPDTKPVKMIILLTDGKATAWTDEKDGNKIKSGDASSAKAAHDDADILAAGGIVVHTIALATPGSDEIDLDLLNYIATKTGGMAYQASSTAELAKIFDNITKTIEAPAKLSNVVLRQPIPEGFILAPEGNASNVSFDSTKREVVVNIGDIPFPFLSDKIDLAINLIPETAAGDYPMQDAKVTFKDACSANQTFNIDFDTTLSVSIRVIDKYGNVYLGNSKGEIQRLRASDKERQWTIDEKDAAATDIKFEDPDHSIVQVSYRDGTKSRWDLKPSAPTGFVLLDGSGNVISDTGWHKGAGLISSFSGSGNQLPAVTQYGNEDFRNNYLAGYQYQVGAMNWTDFNSSTGVVLQDGKDIQLQARAYTNSISGTPSIPLYSAPGLSQVSLDSTGPVISWMKTSSDPSKDADLTITASETLSPVTSIRVWFDGNPSAGLTVDASRLTQSGNTYTYSFKLSQVPGFGTEESRIGWHQIMYEATSAGGTTTSAPDTFVVNPGPTGEMTPVDYTQYKDIADRPVTVNVTTSHPVTARFSKPAFTVKDKYYLISTDSAVPPEYAAWKKLPSTRLTVTTETDVTKGTYYVFLKLVDDQGIASISPTPVAIQFDMEQNRY
ncbi:vWA domain-containing protein [Paenibacillus sp. HJGM_3]|uniref:vWA domain-containing protein n=1 Tax=Paenibacillus sp. HJGM_3 TaxID=3379816 RepID=UPI00385D5348